MCLLAEMKNDIKGVEGTNSTTTTKKFLSSFALPIHIDAVMCNCLLAVHMCLLAVHMCLLAVHVCLLAVHMCLLAVHMCLL